MFRNIETKKRLLNGSIVVLLSAAVMTASLAGCSSGKKSSSEASPDEAAATEVVTRVVNGVYVDENGNIVTDPNGQAVSAPTEAGKTATTKAADSGNKQQSGSSSGNTGNSGSNGNSGNTNNGNNGGSGSNQQNNGSGGNSNNGGGNSGNVDNSSRKTTPSNAKSGNTQKKSQENASATNLTIGDRTYNVGDTVKCTFFLYVPVDMLNFQGKVEFDPALLKVKSAQLIAPASFGAMINTGLGDHVSFNGSDLSGYDFTDPGYEFLTVEYEVLGTGTIDPSVVFDVLTDLNDKAYAGNGGALTGGAKIWAVYE